MFQIFKQPRIDFLGKTKICVSLSIVMVIASVVILATQGLRRGIEFTGGTEIQVKYAARPDVGAIRSSLGRAGFANNVVTTIGRPEENEVYIRIGLQGENDEGDLSPRIVASLRSPELQQKIDSGLLNVNTADEESLALFFRTAPDMTDDAANGLAKGVMEARKEKAIFVSLDDLAGLPGMNDAVMNLVRNRAFAGPFSIRSQSFIGPVIGRELVEKALFAILGSLAGMLVYIWVRFQFQWGLATVIALIHDTLISLAIFSVAGFELTLPVVASFLTLVGYSANDTVVVFDRVRENIKLRGAGDLRTLINDSINQTLSRTVLTSMLTWFVCLSLLLLGGEVLRGFAFVLVIGIIIGTYSSIYVASPILVVWKAWRDRRQGESGGRPESAKAAARKVRAGGKA